MINPKNLNNDSQVISDMINPKDLNNDSQVISEKN